MNEKSPALITTITEAARRLREKTVRPVDLVRQCFSQIDVWEKHVKAWVFVDREGALEQAEVAAKELDQRLDRGPLHGIPIGIKDIFDVEDWPTAAGFAPWVGAVARGDASVVKALRDAGAIFLGKTVTTQFASFDPPPTKNPWDISRTPGGSSSGSAAATSTLMCFAALGSQTGGSITRPASYCGVAGLKPSFGALPVDGVVPLAPRMDHAGPIARCAADLQLMLAPMIAKSVALDFTSGRPDARSIRFVRLGGLFCDLAEAAAGNAIDAVCTKLADAGYSMAESAPPPAFADVLIHHRRIMAVEAGAYHARRLKKQGEFYGPRIRSLCEEGLACPAPSYAWALSVQESLRREMDAFARQHGFLVTPATTGPAPDCETTGNPAFNSPWSFVGLPTISIPTGDFEGGLPLCVQIAGPMGSEAELLRVAVVVETVIGASSLLPPALA